MKRYWLFMWDMYEPAGGMGDFTSDHNSVATARAKVKREMAKPFKLGHKNPDAWHIVDSHTGQVVTESK